MGGVRCSFAESLYSFAESLTGSRYFKQHCRIPQIHMPVKSLDGLFYC